MPHLVTLNLANNPVCEMKSYRHYVLRRLLKLETLDGRPVSEVCFARLLLFLLVGVCVYERRDRCTWMIDAWILVYPSRIHILLPLYIDAWILVYPYKDPSIAIAISVWT